MTCPNLPHWTSTGQLRFRKIVDANDGLLGEFIEQEWELKNWTLAFEPAYRKEWRPIFKGPLPVVIEHRHWINNFQNNVPLKNAETG